MPEVSGSAGVLDAFAVAVERFRDRPAVRVGGEALTYSALDEASEGVARHVDRCVGASDDGVTVGLLVSRTARLIPSLLGIMKAGRAYVPVDPWLPVDRVEAMLTDAAAAAVVSDGTCAIGPWAARNAVPVLDPAMPIATCGGSARFRPAQPEDAAYVIFTSGSTGRPKGVVISHANLAAFCAGWARAVPFGAGRSIATLATIGFDIFLAETLVPLLNGTEVVLATDEDVASPDALNAFLLRERCDMMQATPSRMRWIVTMGRPAETLASMRTVVVGGEPLTAELADRIFTYTDARLFNAYGPTETTVWTSVQEIRPGDAITIGRPIPGVGYEVRETEDPGGGDGTGELVITGRTVGRYLSATQPDSGGFFMSSDGRPGFAPATAWPVTVRRACACWEGTTSRSRSTATASSWGRSRRWPGGSMGSGRHTPASSAESPMRRSRWSTTPTRPTYRSTPSAGPWQRACRGT